MVQGMQPELQGYPFFVLSCLLLAEIERAQQKRLAEEQTRQPAGISEPPVAGAFPSESTASGPRNPAEPRAMADGADNCGSGRP